MTAIVNTNLILEDSIIYDGVLTFENGKLSLDQAESVMELINAQSESGARAALSGRL